MALTNKQLKFAQLIVSGMKQVDAYRGAYNTANMKDATIVNSAYKLMQNGDIAAMIDSLTAKVMDEVVEKIAIDKAWVIGKLVQIVDLGMAVEPVIDNDGSNSGELKTANLSASNKALELIGKEHGMFVDRKDIKMTTHEASLDDLD